MRTAFARAGRCWRLRSPLARRSVASETATADTSTSGSAICVSNFSSARQTSRAASVRQAFRERIDRRDAVDVDEFSSPPSTTSVSGWSIVRGLANPACRRSKTRGRRQNSLPSTAGFHQRQCRSRRAVVEHEFKNGLRAALRKRLTPAATILPRAVRGFLELQFADGREMPAVLVTARLVQQQIFDGENVQPRELPRAFLAHAPDAKPRARRAGKFCFPAATLPARYKPDEGESNATGAKRQRTGALQDASRFTTAIMSRASVLDCGGPPPLFPAGRSANAGLKRVLETFDFASA